METVQPLWRIVRKTVLKTELPSDLATPLPDIYLEKKEPEFEKTTPPMFSVALRTLAMTWKQLCLPGITCDRRAVPCPVRRRKEAMVVKVVQS